MKTVLSQHQIQDHNSDNTKYCTQCIYILSYDSLFSDNLFLLQFASKGIQQQEGSIPNGNSEEIKCHHCWNLKQYTFHIGV